MDAIIDRIEEGWAIIELTLDDGGILRIEWPEAFLPAGSREGDQLKIAMVRAERADEETTT